MRQRVKDFVGGTIGCLALLIIPIFVLLPLGFAAGLGSQSTDPSDGRFVTWFWLAVVFWIALVIVWFRPWTRGRDRDA